MTARASAATPVSLQAQLGRRSRARRDTSAHYRALGNGATRCAARRTARRRLHRSRRPRGCFARRSVAGLKVGRQATASGRTSALRRSDSPGRRCPSSSLTQAGACTGRTDAPWTAPRSVDTLLVDVVTVGTAPGRNTVAGGGGRFGSARGFAAERSPEGRAELRTRARRAVGTPPRLTSRRSGDCDELEVMVALGLVGRAVAERGVQPPAVVELLDVLEDRAARLLVGGERPPAQPLLLQRGEEALLGGVVVRAAFAAVGLRDPVGAARRAERDSGVLTAAIGVMDRSLRPAGAGRRPSAARAATSGASATGPIAHPTILRLKQSNTLARCSTPSPVGICFRSEHHSSFGPAGWKSRLTRSGQTLTPSTPSTPSPPPRRRLGGTYAPWMPSTRISRSTRLRLTSWPSRRS